ncbi:MAG: hypothetical protein RLZ31_560, partial [Pseudomonadota bacterium]
YSICGGCRGLRAGDFGSGGIGVCKKSSKTFDNISKSPFETTL